MLIGTIGCYHFIPLSQTLPIWHFAFDQDEIWDNDEAIQAEHSESIFELKLMKHGE